MYNKELPLLDFIYEKGFDVLNGCGTYEGLTKNLDSSICVAIANALTTYDLQYIHSKIFKLPKNYFDESAVRCSVVDRLHAESIKYLKNLEDKYEIVSQKEYKKIQKQNAMKVFTCVYAAILIIIIALIISIYRDTVRMM